MTGTLLLVATVLALSLAASLPWRSWVAADLGRFYRRDEVGWAGPAFALYLGALAAVITVLGRIILTGFDPFAGWHAFASRGRADGGRVRCRRGRGVGPVRSDQAG